MNDTQSLPTSRMSRQEYWCQHVEKWKSSDLSQILYYKNQQLKLATFQYWKSKLDRISLDLQTLSAFKGWET